MINILLNTANFDEAWAYGSLENILLPRSRVVILPLSYDEGWIQDAYAWKERYGKGSRNYEYLVRPFRSFGIFDRDISWIDFYAETEEDARRKIREADILLLYGRYPDRMMQRLQDLGISVDISRFPGTVIGISAGAAIQLDAYHMTAENGNEFQMRKGLGLLRGFDAEMHYVQNLPHIYGIIRCLEDTGRPLAAIPERGGLLSDGVHFELLGDAFILEQKDLDELYQAYDYLRCGY